jgi:hypothetical protein
MDIRRQRIFFGLAEVIVVMAAVFLLLDAILGFTARSATRSVQERSFSQYLESANLSASCGGGFSNKQTVKGVTQVASRGTPFNAYRLAFTNMGDAALTIRSVNVALIGSQNRIFARHRSDLGDGAGLTVRPGQSSEIVEAYGIDHPVASCQILSWRS